MPTLSFNNAPVSETMWEDDSETKAIGQLEPKELATLTSLGNYGAGTNMKGYTAELGWHSCYVQAAEKLAQDAYSPQYAIKKENSSRYIFNVRRQCRIWDDNSNHVDTLQAGDQIITDGTSTAGEKHPDRLNINGYIKNGDPTYFDISHSNRWCDTDINIGYSTNPTVYGNW